MPSPSGMLAATSSSCVKAADAYWIEPVTCLAPVRPAGRREQLLAATLVPGASPRHPTER
jgi:hypothetical protein